MIERRFTKGAEVRATNGDKPQIGGYASVFGEEYVLYDDSSYRVVETIKPGAFSKVLKELPSEQTHHSSLAVKFHSADHPQRHQKFQHPD